MPRHNRVMEGMIHDSCKIRKRGCSSSSSISSKVHNYRFKRAILVGKRLGGVGSRSSTPVPTWKTTASVLRGGAVESPKYDSGRSRPVSARKLAATLWEMNEMPSPRVMEEEKKLLKRREKMRSVLSGLLPPYLSDPSHSLASERMDRSGTGSHQRRTPSVSQRHRLTERTVGAVDSLSSASLMETETKPQAQTPSGSIVGVRTHLKDISNALSTSKELLKIINRIWAHNDPPSSSMSLVSALHAELERGRLQVNQLIKEQRSVQSEINYLEKCFAEEKASWKIRQQRAIEAAVESIAGELEAERKIRRRFESLNKKLGRELSETKVSFTKAVKELESEKRAREILKQVCNGLASDIGEDRAEVEELNRESAKVHEEVEREREREMLQLADELQEERVQMKLLEGKHQFGEKNALMDKLRNQLEAFLKPKKSKKKGCAYVTLGNEDNITTYLSRTKFASTQNKEKEDDGEVVNEVDNDEDLAESDLHSIELNMDNNNKNFKWTHASIAAQDSRRVYDEMRRNSISGKVPRKSTSIQRSISDGVEWGIGYTDTLKDLGDVLDQERFHKLGKQAQRRGYGDELLSRKSAKDLRDQILSGCRIGSAGDFLPSPTREWGQPRPSRDPGHVLWEIPHAVQGSSSKSRLGEARAEGQNARRSKR